MVGVGAAGARLSALERRLLELGFVRGEHIEILAEARPGRDPFVVRVGHTTLALRRREAQSVRVELQHSRSAAQLQREQHRRRAGRAAASMNASAAAAAVAAPQLSLSLIGVPNCGKTALFNRLTGSRQKVANYPGVTVERKEGRLTGPRSGRTYRVVDLPGAYSLEPDDAR